MPSPPTRIALFANTDWYLYNFRLSLAEALRAKGVEVLLISPDGPYGEQLVAKGFRWIALPMARRGLNPFREAGLILQIARLLKQEKVDLVHGFTIKAAVYAGLAGRIAGLRAWVASVTGLGWTFINQGLAARALRIPVRTLIGLSLKSPRARLILQNRTDFSEFLAAGLATEGQTRLIPSSGVDCERFCPPGDREPGPTRVLMAARLLWDKGLAEYVGAARRLRADGVEARFLLAGDTDPGNPAAVEPDQVKRWVDEGVIEWLGHQEEMVGLYRSAEIVVLPSYREGLSRVLIEAIACGRAVVTTDVPGCRDVVTDQTDGLLVPVKDEAALADAILRLIEDRSLAVRLGKAARQGALDRFEQGAIARRTMEVYEELLGPL